MEYFYGQDNHNVDDINLSYFNLDKGDLKYSKSNKKEQFDFVGFVLDESSLLTVFPKNFYNANDLKEINRNNNFITEEIKLLFDVFIKYTNETNTTAKATTYIGGIPEFKSDYPFAPFFEIYRYFKQFGIYRESNVEIKPSASGAINWKKTLQKSQVVVSNGNLVFFPFYRNKRKDENVFLSECMVFVIDYTINSFPYFLKLPRTGYKIGSFDFIKHREYTLQKLRQINSTTYKDSSKRLIENLIKFFEQYKKTPKGGKIHIKLNYFDRIWERMIEVYLNKYFESVDDSLNKINFDRDIHSSTLSFQTKEFKVDNSPNNFKIRLDHFAHDDESIYIFDSKYYENVSELDYKQFSYNELLRGSVSEDTKIHSALLLPHNNNFANVHFSINPTYLGSKKTGIKIIEQYLNVREVMQTYISN